MEKNINDLNTFSLHGLYSLRRDLSDQYLNDDVPDPDIDLRIAIDEKISDFENISKMFIYERTEYLKNAIRWFLIDKTVQFRDGWHIDPNYNDAYLFKDYKLIAKITQELNYSAKSLL